MGGELRQATGLIATFDPGGLTVAQREGNACVICHKRWPRPRFRVGRLPDDSPVRSCDDCVDILMPATIAVPRARRAEAALT